jgi:curved DNA-binding protein CbpA
VDAPLALGELLAISGLPEAQARQCVYALALGGFLARAVWPAALSSPHAPAQTPADKPLAAGDASAQTATQAKDAPEPTAPNAETTPDPRTEIDALFALVYDANHFQILDVGRSANEAEIKRAYYALAKRFHPDRFQRDATDSERTQIEAAFMKITQAYETLRDPRARSAYELKLGTQIGGSASSQSSDRSAKSNANSNLPREQRAAESFAQGVAALKENNLSSAVTLLGEATRLDPQQSRYHAFYGSALARDVRTRHQAEAELQTAIKLDGNDPAYRVMLAELLRVLGQLLRAERELERALSLDPNHDAARRMLNQVRKAKQQ